MAERGQIDRRGARPVPVRPPGTARQGARWVFADTSYFVALLDKADGRHADAKRLAAELAPGRVQVFSTWEVVVETLTLLGTGAGPGLARRFAEGVLPSLRLVRLTREEEALAIAAFLRFVADHRVSLCDVVSWYVVTRHLGHAPCLTFDADFRSLGLRVLA